MSRWNFLLVAALAAVVNVDALYYEGVRPLEFKAGDFVKMKVNAMTSIHTQIPRDYYRMPFCKPTGGPEMISENLGEVLTGNKIQSSPYVIHMKEDSYCEKLCQAELSATDAKRLRLHIKYGYNNNWIIDNLPSVAIISTLSSAATISTEEEVEDKVYRYGGGFPIGFMDAAGTPFINNHVNIYIDYHQFDKKVEAFRVVGFAVEPMSLNHKFNGGYEWKNEEKEGYRKKLDTCPGDGTHIDGNTINESVAGQTIKPDEKVLFTYDVIWAESAVAWASRWDIYLSEDHLVPAQVRCYSIINSIMVVFFLSLIVVSMLVGNLRRDFAVYNALAALADEEENYEADESGWKLIHADLFRPPQNYPMLFCVCCGGGVQLLFTIFATIFFSAIGFLSPARRGSLVNGILSFYVLTGILSGYVSSRLYKSFKGRLWQVCTVVTALLFPGVAFAIFVFFNIVLSFSGSSASVPFFYIVIVFAMCCCVSVPLVFVGAYFGYKQDSIEFPTVTSTIARAIPETSPISNPKIAMLIAGIVPFAVVYVELFLIMTSLWLDQYYNSYAFGFTLVVFFILIITCAEVTLLLVYNQLCAENYRWWWFSFFAPGSTALYIFVYSIFWFKELAASKMITSYILYFGSMGLICTVMFLVTGTVGALSSLWFVKTIFGTIKVDK